MLLDSNLIIYASQTQHGALRRFIAREAPYISVVSKVETLGYHKLGENEKRFLEEFFDAAEVLPVSGSRLSPWRFDFVRSAAQTLSAELSLVA